MAIISPIHFYRDRLPSKEMIAIYDKLETAMLARETSIIVPWEPWMSGKTGGLSNLLLIEEYVVHDQPGLFYVNAYSISCFHLLFTATISWKHLYRDAEIETLEQQLKQRIAAFKSRCITPAMDSAQVEKVIFDELANTIAYIDRSPDLRWITAYDKNFEQQNAVGALLKREAVCEGVATAFKMLADACRLITIVVCGTAGGGRHAWNMVKVKGCFYHVDATWGLKHSLEDVFLLFRYGYFNLPDWLMREDHTPECSFLPACSRMDGNPFRIMHFAAGSMTELTLVLLREITGGRKLFCVLYTGRECREKPEVFKNELHSILNSRISGATTYYINGRLIGIQRQA